MKLVENPKHVLKSYSVAAFSGILGFEALYSQNPALQEMVPPEYKPIVTGSLSILGLIGRFILQK